MADDNTIFMTKKYIRGNRYTLCAFTDISFISSRQKNWVDSLSKSVYFSSEIVLCTSLCVDAFHCEKLMEHDMVSYLFQDGQSWPRPDGQWIECDESSGSFTDHT